MRVVLDTNVLVSALLVESSPPAQLITHWRQGRFTLLTAQQEGRQRRAERRQRDRQVLRLEDFTEEDLKAILAVEPSPAAAGFDDETP